MSTRIDTQQNDYDTTVAPAEKIDADKMQRVLLLDDENEIVDLCAAALKKQYLVVKTNSPFEAISFMDAGRHMIDLVICDYTMPGMNGIEFVEKIREIGVRTPVILFTGLAADLRGREFGKFTKVLEKPFSIQKLLGEVGATLSATKSGAEAYKKHRGIVPQLDISLENLAQVLKKRGLDNPAALNPKTALEMLGLGETYSIFLSWHYLEELRLKILQ